MRVTFFFIFTLQALWAFAQKHDNIWLFGSGGGNQSPLTDSFGVTILDFSKFDNPQVIENQHYVVNFAATNAGMCDSVGNLLFYTNGEHIYSHNHQKMLNGSNIAVGDGYGYRLPQAAIALPFPKQKNQYVVVTVEDHPQYTYGWKLFYHVIDMNLNNGLGEVVDKRHLLVSDSLTWGRISAVKHANGRDWWFLIPEQFSNRFYTGLISASGITIKNQQVGEQILAGGGAATFSPDGKRYIWANHKNFVTPATIDIFDFDRCTGLLSNQRSHNLYDPLHFHIGVSLSPDSRYLYASDNLIVYQYDLSVDDIFSTEKIVAVWDGTKYYIWPTDFYLGQAAPDGRIYVNTSNGSTSMHYIGFPNRGGGDCKFVQNGILTPTVIKYEMPNFPNYRLGPIDGSPCDTLGIDNHPLANFRWEQENITETLRVTFTDLSAYEPETWQWDFGDGTTSQDTSPVHIYPQPNIYNVCLIVSNINSSDTICRVVNVGVSSINEEQTSPFDIIIYPNPVSSNLVMGLKGLDYLRGSVFMYDIAGRQVASKIWTGQYLDLDMSHLQAGIYFYEVLTDRGSIKKGKIIKQ